jgi:uncharacterized protein YciI
MHWINYCTDKPGSLSLREAHIVRHRAYLETKPINVVMSGPLMDDAGEKMNGSFFLVEAESRSEVNRSAGTIPSSISACGVRYTSTGFTSG